MFIERKQILLPPNKPANEHPLVVHKSYSSKPTTPFLSPSTPIQVTIFSSSPPENKTSKIDDQRTMMLSFRAHTRADAQQISRDLFRTGTGEAAMQRLLRARFANFNTHLRETSLLSRVIVLKRRKKLMRKRGSSSCANLTSCYHHTGSHRHMCST